MRAALASLSAQLAAAISSHAAANKNTELMARLVELVSTIASNNASQHKLIALMENFTGSSRSAASTKRPAPASAVRKKPTTQPSAKHAPGKYSLSVSQAARLLNKAPSTVRTWCEVGKLKAVKIDGVWRIQPQSLKKKPLN